jgi:hypothetical protein
VRRQLAALRVQERGHEAASQPVCAPINCTNALQGALVLDQPYPGLQKPNPPLPICKQVGRSAWRAVINVGPCPAPTHRCLPCSSSAAAATSATWARCSEAWPAPQRTPRSAGAACRCCRWSTATSATPRCAAGGAGAACRVQVAAGALPILGAAFLRLLLQQAAAHQQHAAVKPGVSYPSPPPHPNPR